MVRPAAFSLSLELDGDVLQRAHRLPEHRLHQLCALPRRRRIFSAEFQPRMLVSPYRARKISLVSLSITSSTGRIGRH